MEHEIVMDLLPLYHDGVCSAASRAAVEEHLKECEVCREARKNASARFSSMVMLGAVPFNGS